LGKRSKTKKKPKQQGGLEGKTRLKRQRQIKVNKK
jgi:hypothetical protein